MKHGQYKDASSNYIGITVSVGVVALVLMITGKRMEPISQRYLKRTESLNILDTVAGCNLDEFGAVLASGKDNDIPVNIHLVNPRTCNLVIDQIEILRDIGPVTTGKRQVKLAQNSAMLENAMC